MSNVAESKFVCSIIVIRTEIIAIEENTMVGTRKKSFVPIQIILARCLKFLHVECFKTFKILLDV